MNYRRRGKGGRGARRRIKSQGKTGGRGGGGGMGLARQLAHACHADREPIAGIPGASLDWQRARLSRRRRRFSFKAVSVKRPSELFSRGRRVANEPSPRRPREDTRDRGGGAPAKRARGQRKKERKKKEERDVSLAYLIITNRRRRRAVILRQSPRVQV